MKFFTVCTLPRFHPHHVYRLLAQLHMFYTGPIEFYVYTDRPDEFDSRVIAIPIKHNKCVRQWYKIDFFGPDIVPNINEPIIVMDLDWSVVKNIDAIIDIAIAPNTFIATPRWWRDDDDPLPMSGGLYKFTPAGCHYMWECFYKTPDYWQQKYKNPDHPFSVQGEQDFVYEHASEKHKMVMMPGNKFARIARRLDKEHENMMFTKYSDTYNRLYGGPYMVNGTWNDQIAMIHG